MRRIGFAFNPTRAATFELRDRALEWCADHGVNAWAAESGAYNELVAHLAGTDCLVVLGGDGTFLRAASALAKVDVPVLGVNSGRVGFLSKAEPDALERVLGELVAGSYTLEARMMLEARVHRRGVAAGLADGDEANGPFAALNDAAVVRGAQVRVIHLEISIDGSHVATWLADGVVVATPTGSTAYSFSVRGPIVSPSVDCLLVTPVAAHMVFDRTLVLDPGEQVILEVLGEVDGLLSADGRETIGLSVGTRVRIRAADTPFRLVRRDDAPSFLGLVREKFDLPGD
jgi:NAD+ kinase